MIETAARYLTPLHHDLGMIESDPVIDFYESAQAAALSKVTDISNGNAPLMHSFVRYSLGFNQNTLGDKITGTPGIDRLRANLRYGVVSKQRAEELGIPFDSNFGSPQNETGVSLDASGYITEGFRWLNGYYYRYGEYIPDNEKFMMLVDPKLPVDDRLRSYHYEVVREQEVPTRSLMGVVLYSDRLSRQDDTHRVIEVVKIMEEEYSDQPESFVPVYDYSGFLRWPYALTPGETKIYAHERNAN